jgi:hypothetical protein
LGFGTEFAVQIQTAAHFLRRFDMKKNAYILAPSFLFSGGFGMDSLSLFDCCNHRQSKSGRNTRSWAGAE